MNVNGHVEHDFVLLTDNLLLCFYVLCYIPFLCLCVFLFPQQRWGGTPNPRAVGVRPVSTYFHLKGPHQPEEHAVSVGERGHQHVGNRIPDSALISMNSWRQIVWADWLISSVGKKKKKSSITILFPLYIHKFLIKYWYSSTTCIPSAEERLHPANTRHP